MTDKNNEKINKNKEEPGGLRVKPINNGTVIDHIAGGQALNVLKILGISGTTGATVSGSVISGNGTSTKAFIA